MDSKHLTPILVANSCQYWNELHPALPTHHPKTLVEPRLRQASAPIPRRLKVGKPREAMGDSAWAHLQGPPVRKDPKEATVNLPPVACAIPRRRRLVSREHQVGLGREGGGRRAQGPGSRIQESDVTQDPGSLCGSREWGW